MKTLALIAAAGVASTATAQDLTITVDTPDNSFTNWVVTAEITDPASVSANAIVQVWADASFVINGSNINIDPASVNPAYTTTLGPFVISDNGTDSVGFVGNANSFFGTPDSSNPLTVLEFTADGIPTSLDLVGQNSAIFDQPPFGEVILFQDALGNLVDPNTGEPYASFEVIIVPAPASAALLGLGGLAAVRRRR
ncbi:MAG: PEP-CTERM sorting domain-containing protein [Planctomycetota bacterium]